MCESLKYVIPDQGTREKVCNEVDHWKRIVLSLFQFKITNLIWGLQFLYHASTFGKKNYINLNAVLKRPSKHTFSVILLPTHQTLHSTTSAVFFFYCVNPAHCGLYVNRAIDPGPPAEGREQQPIRHSAKHIYTPGYESGWREERWETDFWARSYKEWEIEDRLEVKSHYHKDKR